MNNVYTLQRSYLVATPKVSHELLEGSLIYLYQVEDQIASGLILNKPHPDHQTLGDFLAYPNTILDRPVWQGGPISKERVICFYQKDSDIYITDRLSNLSAEQLESSLFFSGQCMWDEAALVKQIKQGDWMLIGSNKMIPNQLPAEMRVDYLMKLQGISQGRVIHGDVSEVV